MIDIGIAASDRKTVAEKLGALLADTYTLYLRTHNYHWNVTGSMFQTLHVMFEEQYLELARAVDLLAERVRALGHLAPGSYREFLRLSSVTESEEVPASGEEMIHSLIEGHEAVIRSARRILPIAFESDDEVSAEIVTGRLRVHEKTVWMLRSVLGE